MWTANGCIFVNALLIDGWVNTHLRGMVHRTIINYIYTSGSLVDMWFFVVFLLGKVTFKFPFSVCEDLMDAIMSLLPWWFITLRFSRWRSKCGKTSGYKYIRISDWVCTYASCNFSASDGWPGSTSVGIRVMGAFATQHSILAWYMIA